MDDKFSRQADQYAFPYHHLVDIARKSFGRTLPWGLDYYNYLRQVDALVRQYAQGNILDVGCGDGALLYSLRQWLEKMNWSGYGIDIDEKPIKFAQAFGHGWPQLKFSVQDIFSYNQRFTLITCVETLEHIPDDRLVAFTTRLGKLLVPGGVLIISVPTTNFSLRPKHHRHFNLPALLAYFANYQVLGKYYITARRRWGYNLLERLLCNSKFNLNFSFFRQWLFALNEKFYWHACPNTGSHLLVVLKKQP